MKKHFPKIKKVIKEKDNRFWLMIFVVVSTLVVFVIWISDFNNIFFNDKVVKGNDLDLQSIKNEGLAEFNKNFEDFSSFLGESLVDVENNDTNKLNLILEQSVSEKIKGKEAELELANENSKVNSLENIDELQESEENIENLKRKIEELEQKIEKNN